MTIRSNFHGDFVAKAARRGRFGTHGLSGVSNFATQANDLPEWRMKLRKLLLTAALVACASPALADSFVSTSNCKYSQYYGYNNCRETWTQIPDPVRNPEQERQDALALQKEDAKWMAFCKPVFRADEFGVRRATYSAKGCEFGRSE